MRTRSSNGQRVFVLLGTLFVAVAVAVAASAQYQDGGEMESLECPHSSSGGAAIAEHIFDMSDTNGDDALSPEEFAAAGLERYGMNFEAYDVDEDGFTSFDEYLDVFEAHHPPGEMI
jgi:hypothetical protein